MYIMCIYHNTISVWESILELETAHPESNGDYYPFASKMSALLYMILKSPRPMVCGNV